MLSGATDVPGARPHVWRVTVPRPLPWRFLNETKVLAMQMLLRLAPERGKRLVASAMEGRAAMSIYAGVLAGGVEDPVALYLPALASREPDFAAMAAATLRASEGPSALQR